MYKEDFKIRDFVRKNAEEWELFNTLKSTLKQMQQKINYESLYRDKDIGRLSEYLAIALINYRGNDIYGANKITEELKTYIDNEREAE